MMQALARAFYACEEGSPYHRHDAGYSSLLYNKSVFLEFLQSFVGESWVEDLGEHSIIRVDKKYVLSDFAEKEADIVYKCQIGDKQVIFYILIELQSTVDFLMPYRLLLYMVEIWRDEFKNTPRLIRGPKDFELPPIVSIVLYNGKCNWTACKNFRDIVEKSNQFENYIPDFEYLLIHINRLDEKHLLETANLISSVFYIDQKRDTDEVYRRLDCLKPTVKDFDSNKSSLFTSWIKNVICQGLSEDVQRKVSNILDSDLEVDLMISNLTETLREEYQRKWQEGIAKGKTQRNTEIVIKLLTKKFGRLSEEMEGRICTANESQLEAIIDDIFQIQSLEEVAKFLSKRDALETFLS